MITGRTTVLFMIGDPVDKVHSPTVFNTWFGKTGRDAVMVPLRVEAAGLDAFFEGLRHWPNVLGCVITFPHKQNAMKALDVVSETARRVGGVNVVRREADGRLVGDITDGHGYVAAVKAHGRSFEGKSFLLIGAGCAGSAIAHAVAAEGAARIVIRDRNPNRRRTLCRALSALYPGLVCSDGDETHAAPDIVCNATPLGMSPGDPAPWPLKRLAPGTFVSDIVPIPTPWLAAARSSGFETMTGQEMVEGQFVILRRLLLGTDKEVRI